MKLFISWSSNEMKDFALGLNSWIPATRATVKPWVSCDPKCLPAGNNFPDKIIAAIDSCDACLVLVTKSNLNSSWINFETGFFFGRKKPVFAMLCDDISHNDIQSKGHPLAANGVNFTYPTVASLNALFVSLEGTSVDEQLVLRSVNNSFHEFKLLHDTHFGARAKALSGLIAGLDDI
jgi:TIR domain